MHGSLAWPVTADPYSFPAADSVEGVLIDWAEEASSSLPNPGKLDCRQAEFLCSSFMYRADQPPTSHMRIATPTICGWVRNKKQCYRIACLRDSSAQASPFDYL